MTQIPTNDSNGEMPDATDAGSGDASTDGAVRISSRTLAFVLASCALAVVCVMFALKYFVGERLPEITEAKVEAAMDLWERNGPPSYDMDLELRGAQPGLVHVEVRNGEVTAQTRNGRVPGRWTWNTWSVPGLFDTLLQDLQIASNPAGEIQAATGTQWRLRGEFDSRLGYPAQYHRLVNRGPEVFWRVTDFQPR